MTKTENTKMKFFARRDWHILHFVLTLAIGVVVGVMATIFWEYYNHSLEDTGSVTLWMQNSERMRALEKHLKLQLVPNEDGSYSYRERTQADEDFENRAISNEEYNKIMNARQ
ncbi:MAG: hypothetical protein Q4A27_01825 [bacterium]|nr:hypothetical protein [bacterium]